MGIFLFLVYSVTSALGAVNKVLLIDISENKEESETDLLITFDYHQVNPDSPSCSSDSPMRIASIQFNTMNIIGKHVQMILCLHRKKCVKTGPGKLTRAKTCAE